MEVALIERVDDTILTLMDALSNHGDGLRELDDEPRQLRLTQIAVLSEALAEYTRVSLRALCAPEQSAPETHPTTRARGRGHLRSVTRG